MMNFSLQPNTGHLYNRWLQNKQQKKIIIINIKLHVHKKKYKYWSNNLNVLTPEYYVRSIS